MNLSQFQIVVYQFIREKILKNKINLANSKRRSTKRKSFSLKASILLSKKKVHIFSGENPNGSPGGGNGNAECRNRSIGELFEKLFDTTAAGCRSFDVSDSMILKPGFESESGGVGVLVEGIMPGLGIGGKGDLW